MSATISESSYSSKTNSFVPSVWGKAYTAGCAVVAGADALFDYFQKNVNTVAEGLCYGASWTAWAKPGFELRHPGFITQMDSISDFFSATELPKRSLELLKTLDCLYLTRSITELPKRILDPFLLSQTAYWVFLCVSTISFGNSYRFISTSAKTMKLLAMTSFAFTAADNLTCLAVRFKKGWESKNEAGEKDEPQADKKGFTTRNIIQMAGNASLFLLGACGLYSVRTEKEMSLWMRAAGTSSFCLRVLPELYDKIQGAVREAVEEAEKATRPTRPLLSPPTSDEDNTHGCYWSDAGVKTGFFNP